MKTPKINLYEKSLQYNSVQPLSKTKEYRNKKGRDLRAQDGRCKRCAIKLDNETDRLCNRCINYSKTFYSQNSEKLREYARKRYTLKKLNNL